MRDIGDAEDVELQQAADAAVAELPRQTAAAVASIRAYAALSPLVCPPRDAPDTRPPRAAFPSAASPPRAY